MNIKKYLKMIIYKFIPVNKKRIVFTSYSGHIEDSPFYIYQEMKKILPSDFELIWLVKKEYLENIDDKDVVFYEFGTHKANCIMASAFIVIDNVYGNIELYLKSSDFKNKMVFRLQTWLRTKKNRHIYSTWHGSPFKKMGIDIPGSNILDFSCPNTTMMLNDNRTLDIIKHLTFNKMKYVVLSSPRNDKLILDNSSIIDIKKKIGLPLDKKIILFAPTFRAQKDVLNMDVNRSGIDQINMIDFNKLFECLKNKFGGEWVFVCRFHYHVSNNVDWESITKKYGNTVINGNNHSDMSDYLLCSDILISDVSSCLIDFSVTNRPSFLFFPDKDYYMNKERGGLYYDIEKLPFSLAVTADKLYENINHFDIDDYIKKVEEFKNEIGFILSQNSTKEMTNFILNDSGLNIKEEK